MTVTGMLGRRTVSWLQLGLRNQARRLIFFLSMSMVLIFHRCHLRPETTDSYLYTPSATVSDEFPWTIFMASFENSLSPSPSSPSRRLSILSW